MYFFTPTTGIFYLFLFDKNEENNERTTEHSSAQL